MNARVARGAQRLLLFCGVAALSYCAFALADAWWYQRTQEKELAALVATDEEPADVPVVIPVKGDMIGRLVIERLGVSVMVAEGVGSRVLRRAAGHIPGTPLPGEPGNTGISAHRDTFFRPLRNIRQDDLISITTPGGEYRYRVVSIRIVGPENVGVLEPSVNEVLTLVTCYPFYYLGAAPDRFIVRAEREMVSGKSIPGG